MTTWHELHTGVVHPWLCDQFGHLNVRNYSNLFNEAQFFAYARAGFPQSVALKHGGHGVAAICRTNFLKELPMGSLINIDGGMVASSNKTFTFFCRMYNVETGELHATSESLEVFFDPTSRKSAVIPDVLRPFILNQINGPDEFEVQPELPRTISQPHRWFETHGGVCFPWHCDQFGHMNVRWYAHFFDDAMFHTWPKIGVNWRDMEARGVHTVTASTTTYFQKEVKSADLFRIESGIGRCGTKSVTFSQRMVNVETQDIHASQSVTEVFFDPNTRSAVQIPEDLKKVILKSTS